MTATEAFTIYEDTLQTVWWDIQADVDLSTAVSEVFLAGAWRTLSWLGAAVESNGKWTRRGAILIAGDNPTNPSAVKPVPVVDARPLTRTTVGGEVDVAESSFKFTFK